MQQPAHSQRSEVASEAGSVAGNDELKVQDLTMMYGTKADRDKVYFESRFNTSLLFATICFWIELYGHKTVKQKKCQSKVSSVLQFVCLLPVN